MDIHRCRFVPYPASAINAVAFSHPSENVQARTPQQLRLAIGRANGDIEIWNPAKGNWFQETTLHGGRDRSIEGLAWTQDPAEEDSEHGGRLRLFSIGLSSSVTEWDLEKGTTLRHANGNYGEIWCFAAQPPYKRQEKKNGAAAPVQDAQSQSQYLAAGCADGNILLFTTEDGDLRFHKVLGAPPTKKPRVLSIAWKNRNVVVAGYSDGTIRLYDIRARKFIRSMTLGKSGDDNDVLVWSIKCLPDQTIISGDSTGEIKIWDSQNYSLVQRLQAHKADVLDIATSADGGIIISGGADRRTVAFKPMGPRKAGKSSRWAEIMHRRNHKHDVKTLATFESKDLSILVSGSLDTVPIVAPLREWASEYHRALPNLPRVPPVCSAPTVRLLASWWDREISIWHLNGSDTTADDPHLMAVPSQDRYKVVAKVLLTDDENITSVDISQNGTALVVSTSTNVKLFALRQKHISGKLALKVRAVELPSAFERVGARIVKFSQDSRWLSAIRPDNTVATVKLAQISDTKERFTVLTTVVSLRRRSRKARGSWTPTEPLGNYERTIISAAYSHDSRVLAVGDISGCIDCWVLEGHEDVTDVQSENTNRDAADRMSDDSDESSDDDDSDQYIHGQQWIHSPSLIPSLSSPILLLSFRPTHAGSHALTDGEVGLHPTRHTPHPHSHATPVQEDRLVAVTAQHQIAEVEVMQGRLSDWSRRNPAAYLPEAFTIIKDRAMGGFWDVGGGNERLYLYGSNWIFMLDMSKDLPEQEVVGKLGHHEVTKPADSVLGKRKLQIDEGLKHNSGAGDAMHVSETYVGMGKKMMKYTGEDQAEGAVQAVNLGNEVETNSEDEDDEDLRSGLAALRRQGSISGEDGEVDPGKQLANGLSDAAKNDDDKAQRRGWWHTFNYRPILGIVPMTEYAQLDGTKNMEIAVVERPLWEIDLPPRYDEGRD